MVQPFRGNDAVGQAVDLFLVRDSTSDPEQGNWQVWGAARYWRTVLRAGPTSLAVE
jgi:hypothetical protein